MPDSQHVDRSELMALQETFHRELRRTNDRVDKLAELAVTLASNEQRLINLTEQAHGDRTTSNARFEKLESSIYGPEGLFAKVQRYVYLGLIALAGILGFEHADKLLSFFI